MSRKKCVRKVWGLVNPIQHAIDGASITPGHLLDRLRLVELSAIESFTKGQATVEDWLTEIAQYSSELCLLAMTEPQVAQIMGEAEPVDPQAIMQALQSGMPPPQPVKPYEWPAERTPEKVFQLVQIKIRAGSTAAPNKLEMQETWTRALPLLQQMIQIIMQVDASMGDSTPFRELVKETAARFDESLDVERFLPPKPMQRPAIPQIPGMQPGMPMPGGIPGQPTLQ